MGETISGAARKFRFGDFDLDLDTYRLSRSGQTLRLERRPMELLILLVQRADRLVTREEIIAHVWPPRTVIDFDTGLNTLVRKVRQALEDSPEQPTFIETVPGKGYRFIAPVQAANVPADDAGTGEESAKPAAPPVRRWALVVAALVVVALAAAVWVTRDGRVSKAAIAVLPFDNISGRQEYDYLADGLAEDTINSLGQLDPDRLQVLGPPSTFAYKQGGKPLAAIGAELGADYIVHSTLRVEGSHLRVTSSLIRSRDQVRVWNAAFDRELTSTLGLQRDLSAAIAEQVRARVSPERAAAVDHRHTTDPAAYDLYLRGRHAWNQRTGASNRAALENYERAIARDPKYALAWAGAAMTLAASPMNSDAAPASILEQTRNAAARAMQESPSLAEALFAQGYFEFWLERDWTSAEKHLRDALSADPNNALVHLVLAHVLSQKQEHVEARTLSRRARELDPMSALTYALSSHIAFQARDNEAALELARQSVAIDPEFWIGYIQLGQVQEQLGALEEALEASRKAERYSGGNSKSLSLQGYVLARAGRKAEARAILSRLESAARERFVPPYALAQIHAGLGDVDAALIELERALEQDDVHLAFLPVDPKWDALRRNARFASLLERCEFTD